MTNTRDVEAAEVASAEAATPAATGATPGTALPAATGATPATVLFAASANTTPATTSTLTTACTTPAASATVPANAHGTTSTPATHTTVDQKAQQGRDKLGLKSMEELVRRARTCRRFDESTRVPEEFLLELVNLAHLCPNGANAQRLRFHVVSKADECAVVFNELVWAAALKDWPGPSVGERPTGYIAILAERAVPGKPASPITEVDCGIAAQTMMLAARSATPEVAACMFKAFSPNMITTMGLNNDRYELKLVMAFGVPVEQQVIEPASASPTGTLTYWRTPDSVHHVPKLALADVLA